MKVLPVLAVLAGLAIVAGIAYAGSTGDPVDIPTRTGAEIAIITYVVDGDTVDVVIDGREERVRLIGIDAPESVSRDTPVQCYGPEASDALTGLLPVGSEVRIQRDVDARDRFGRLLLYVYRSNDDVFVNEWLIANGFADTMFFEPNITYRNRFVGVRNDARTAGVGLWGVCDGPDQPLS